MAVSALSAGSWPPTYERTQVPALEPAFPPSPTSTSTPSPTSPTLPPLPALEDLEASFDRLLAGAPPAPAAQVPPARARTPPSAAPAPPLASRPPAALLAPPARAPAHHVRARSASDVPPRTVRELELAALSLRSLELEDEELPSYAECVRDRPPPMPPSRAHPQPQSQRAPHAHHAARSRSQSFGAVTLLGREGGARPGWVRDPDGQWRQGRRRERPLLPTGQMGPRTDDAAGNGKVWRKRLGVWYVGKPGEPEHVEQVLGGERWRRTLGVWHVVGEA